MKYMKNKCLVLFVLSFGMSIASAKVETVIGSVNLKQNPNLAGFLPQTDLPEILISRKQYVISYNKEKRIPNFAVWELVTSDVGSSGRATFAKDSELEQYLQSTDRAQHAVIPSEYTGSCLDRGHVVPSADRSDNPEDNKETFVMSNMLPQTPHLNRVVWEHLEQYTRDMVKNQNKKVYIVAGPIFDQNVGAIGPNKDIQVPSREFKIVVILDANQSIQEINKETPMIAVILPNVDSSGQLPKLNSSGCSAPTSGAQDKNDWAKFKSSVPEIEHLSGLKIFAPL